MLVRMCSTMIHPREIQTPSKTSAGTVYTTITPTILNDSFCDCRGFHFNGGKCSHTQMVDENQCDWYRWPAEDFAKLTECPDCGAPVEDFETRSEFV
jgi:hypothetical protein